MEELFTAELLKCPLRKKLDDNELERYRQLKRIKDPKRLYALLPAAFKKSAAAPKAKPFIPDMPPQFPSWCNVTVHPLVVRLRKDRAACLDLV